MDNFKKEALEISSEFEFSSFSVVASADVAQNASNSALSSCENHLDGEFMNWLKQGLHLDTSIVPL